MHLTVPASGLFPARWAEGSGWLVATLMAEPGGVTENRDHFKVFHVHFGFDAIAPEDLREVVDELTRHHKPLVYTVHDLRNRGLMSATANAGQPCCKRSRQGYPRGLRRPRGYSTFRNRRRAARSADADDLLRDGRDAGLSGRYDALTVLVRFLVG